MVSTKVVASVEPLDQDAMTGVCWTVDRVAFDDRLVWGAERLRQLAAQFCYRLSPSLAAARVGISAMSPRIQDAVMRREADLYIAHYPAALPAVMSAAQRYGAMFAYDAEDFHLGDLPDEPRYDLAKSIIHTVEASALSDCAYVTAASPGIADAYAKTYSIEKPLVVLNVFPKAQAPKSCTTRGEGESPSVYWFSQVIGPNRGLECAVRALALAATGPHLYLRGTLAEGFGDTLQQLARTHGVSDRLHFLAVAPPSAMSVLAGAFDIGLVAETGGTLNRRIALTNKQFTYLLAGIPAVMSDIPAHAHFALEAKGAAFLYVANEAESLARVLDHLLSSPKRLAASRARSFELGQESFNWEIEKQVLVQTVARTLAGRIK